MALYCGKLLEKKKFENKAYSNLKTLTLRNICTVLFQNKSVFSEMEPALHLANKVVIKLIKVDKVCKVYSGIVVVY